MKTTIIAAVILFLGIGVSIAGENEALRQLQEGTSGNQSTGKTFDGSNKRQPSDAFPKGDVTIPESKMVDKSSGTVSGVDKSSSTFSGVDSSSGTKKSSGKVQTK